MNWLGLESTSVDRLRSGGSCLPSQESPALRNPACFLSSLPLPLSISQRLARQEEQSKPEVDRKPLECLGETIATAREGVSLAKRRRREVRIPASGPRRRTPGLPSPRPDAACSARSSALPRTRMRGAGRARHAAQARFQGRVFRWLLA